MLRDISYALINDLRQACALNDDEPEEGADIGV
jgi:hypothetical protein